MAEFLDSYNYKYIDFDSGSILQDPTLYTSCKSLEILTHNSNLKIYTVSTRFFPTLQSISNSLYGSIDYWYILGILNNIDDALQPLPYGYKLYYLPEDDINTYKKSLTSIANTNPSLANVKQVKNGGNNSQTKSPSRWINGVAQF